jgi:hypothetical protein
MLRVLAMIIIPHDNTRKGPFEARCREGDDADEKSILALLPAATVTVTVIVALAQDKIASARCWIIELA